MDNEMMLLSGGNVEVTDVPEQVKLLPLGKVYSTKGDFFVTKDSARNILEHFEKRKIDIVIDYEHQTLKDMPAPAGGWIKSLSIGEDAILGKVEWTPAAKKHLENKEYRYLSPVVLVSKKTGEAVYIQSVALTNTPAIDGMFAIVNSNKIETYPKEGGKEMDYKELLKALGLPEDAKVETIMKKIVEMAPKDGKPEVEGEKDTKDAKDAKEPSGDGVAATGEGTSDTAVVANSTVMGLLELPEDAKTEEVVAKIMSLKAGDDLDVKMEVLALKQQLKERSADELVGLALKQGKISSSQQDWAKTYALKDEAGFKKFLEQAPQVVPMEQLDLKDDLTSGGKFQASPEILENCDISQQDVEKFYK